MIYRKLLIFQTMWITWKLHEWWTSSSQMLRFGLIFVSSKYQNYVSEKSSKYLLDTIKPVSHLLFGLLCISILTWYGWGGGGGFGDNLLFNLLGFKMSENIGELRVETIVRVTAFWINSFGFAKSLFYLVMITISAHCQSSI